MKKILIITGPTATGKSDLAVETALWCQKNLDITCEIISADSRQVYTGLDIGSAKITETEMHGITHHMIDVADPVSEVFSVVDFQNMAREKMQSIFSRGNVPIVCGGTGLYIDALVYDIDYPAVLPDTKLRSELALLSIEQLREKLQLLAPEKLQTIDQSNPVRLIRAIELASTDEIIPDQSNKKPVYPTLWIGLQLDKEIMLQRITKRITARIPALFDEIQHLRNIGVSDEQLDRFGLEYRYGLMYVLGTITENEFIQLLTTKTWQFSKRQITWFKRNTEINWYNPLTDKQKILEQVKDFLKAYKNNLK